MVSAAVPEPAELLAQPQAEIEPVRLRRGCDGGEGPTERRAEVLELGLDPAPGREVVGGAQERGEVRGDGRVVLGVTVLDRVGLALDLEELAAELRDRPQHPEPGLAVGTLPGADEVDVDELPEDVQRIDPGVQHGSGSGQVELPRRHRQLSEGELERRRQEAVAPQQGRSQALLAFRDVDLPGGDLERVVEPREQCPRTEELDPRGDQLDGERQPVQTPADVADVVGVRGREGEVRPDEPCPADEELDRASCPLGPVVGHRQGWDGVLVLAPQVQRSAGRREDLHARPGREELRDDGRGVGQLLEVVQHEQEAASGEVLDERRRGPVLPGHTQHLTHRGPHHLRGRHRRERHEVHAVRLMVVELTGDRDGEAGLARPP